MPLLNAGLRDHAQQASERLALKLQDGELTYDALERRANRMAHVLRGCGMRRGDHVACMLPNGADIISLAWASYRCGLYFTPIATTLTSREAAYIIDNCSAGVVVADLAFAVVASELPRLSGSTVHWLALAGAISGFSELEPLLSASPETPIADESPGALMLYTSGTTGAPKGVCRPLAPIDYEGMPPFARDLLELFDLGGSAVRYLSTQPLYHAAALRTALAVTAGGGTVVVMSRFDAERALGLLEREQITHSQWVPTMFQRMLALPPELRSAFRAPTHRVAYHGAAPCPLSVKHAMIEWWGPILLEYYAGTEGVGVTTISSKEWLRRPGSVGTAKRGQIHILDQDGHELPAGQPGRIYFAGSAAFAYHGAPEKTLERTHALGWQTLGDIGVLDDEGYLTLTDRADDMIISGGVNIYPQEIESALMELPGVLDCGVVGMPDAEFGERPHAFVVATPAAAQDAEAFRQTLEQGLRERIGRLKLPAGIHLCAEMPRSATGKLLRKQLPALMRGPGS